ncbi:dihydropteroate synthase [Pseudonocardia dioxanivorans]|uniref:dihydropteroate synthase n=1 Tax=Pseudonocardia dioxanivorans TaxID=240495 RepID=UPI000CD2393B|nr:dihydropteroate synthase [Pseudonocardia dioxanivorans]
MADALPVRDRCLVLGILNVTPDSFSDGGRHRRRADAVRYGLRMWAEGADLVDVGGESTRPGAARVEPEEELARVVGVVEDLVAAGVPVSIDTSRRVVAEAAIACGAVLVNDVTGGRADPQLPRLVAETGVGYVVMHSRGPSADMQRRAHYSDVVGEVVDELGRRLDSVHASGVRPGQVVVDPGLGFAKQARHNWELLARLDRLTALGRPVLVGASRKSFLGGTPLGPDALALDVSERDTASVAVAAVAAAAGIWGVRVHDVRHTAQAVQVAAAIRGARPEPRSVPWAS